MLLEIIVVGGITALNVGLILFLKQPKKRKYKKIFYIPASDGGSYITALASDNTLWCYHSHGWNKYNDLPQNNPTETLPQVLRLVK